MSSGKSRLVKPFSRRALIRASGLVGAGLAAHSVGRGPLGFVRDAWAEKTYPALGNYPIKGKTVKFGLTIPLTGAYADEGNDTPAAPLKPCGRRLPRFPSREASQPVFNLAWQQLIEPAGHR